MSSRYTVVAWIDKTNFSVQNNGGEQAVLTGWASQPPTPVSPLPQRKYVQAQVFAVDHTTETSVGGGQVNFLLPLYSTNEEIKTAFRWQIAMGLSWLDDFSHHEIIINGL